MPDATASPQSSRRASRRSTSAPEAKGIRPSCRTWGRRGLGGVSGETDMGVREGCSGKGGLRQGRVGHPWVLEWGRGASQRSGQRSYLRLAQGIPTQRAWGRGRGQGREGYKLRTEGGNPRWRAKASN
eukprot:scaffold9808_cov77-Isochrysis_galbana.AAC.3